MNPRPARLRINSTSDGDSGTLTDWNVMLPVGFVLLLSGGPKIEVKLIGVLPTTGETEISE